MSRMRPSPAMVVAIIALIASVTSGAYAAVNIPDGAVTHPKLADNSVWNRNIGIRSVRNFNINNGAVMNHNMAPNSVWHAQIGMGSVRRNNVNAELLAELHGATGPTGPTGPKGPTGPAGITNTVVVKTDGSVAAGATSTVTATCPSGDHVTGGGYGGASSMVIVEAQSPVTPTGQTTPDAWAVQAMNGTGAAATVSAYAVCT